MNSIQSSTVMNDIHSSAVMNGIHRLSYKSRPENNFLLFEKKSLINLRIVMYLKVTSLYPLFEIFIIAFSIYVKTW